jgi:hypothetical protein
LGVLAVKGRARTGRPLAKLRAALPGFLTLRAFVATFAATAATISQVMEILKHKGLHRSTYQQCCQLAFSITLALTPPRLRLPPLAGAGGLSRSFNFPQAPISALSWLAKRPLIPFFVRRGPARRWQSSDAPRVSSRGDFRALALPSTGPTCGLRRLLAIVREFRRLAAAAGVTAA